MERSRGIILLFDPVHEIESGDAFHHMYGVLDALNQRMRDRRLPGGRLPHYVAVCVTKFDEIKVLETAEQLRMIEYDADEYRFPRVPDDEAREFFEHLCGVSEDSEARTMPSLLAQTFRPERTKYFVTSAIGFYVDPRTGTFDRGNFQNHLPGQGDKEPSRIRGPVHPINVVEPMLWLGRSLTGEGTQ